MDGILIDSEAYWDRARVAVVAEFGGTYHGGVAGDVMGMSPPEWSRYLRDRVGIPLEPERIESEVVRYLVDDYERERPFFPGAVEVVRAVSARWPTAIASSSGRELIDLVVALAGLSDAFTATVSGAEVARGKPFPDVYLRAAELLKAEPGFCLAIEDSANGIRAAKNAGMRVIAIPHPDFPVSAAALATADLVIARISDVTPTVVERLFAAPRRAG